MTSPRTDSTLLGAVSRRQDLLSVLESTPLSKHELAETLDCSRSTVDRAIRELEQRSLVDRRPGGFALTVAGRLALAEYRRSLERFEAIGETGHLLASLPQSAPMSTAMLEGATVHEPTAHAPNEPLEDIARRLDGANRFRGLVTAERLPQFRTLVYDGTVAGELDVEVVLTDDLLGFLCANRSEQLREVMATGQFRIHAIPSAPYGLAVIERASGAHVFVVLTTETGDVTTVLENDSPAALEWGLDVYRRYRATATSIPPPPSATGRTE